MGEELKSMKQTLMAAAQGQMGNLDKVNAEELGEVIDMIKDITEAEYYCAIVKAMDENKEEQKISEKMITARNRSYYTPYMRYLDPRYDDLQGSGYPGGMNQDRKMYYNGNGNMGAYTSGMSGNNGNSSSSENGGSRGYYDPYCCPPGYLPPEMRDYREGRSALSRRGYMESKEMHQDSGTTLHKLEKYVNELSNDIVEMTADSTPEEKNLLYQKLTTLANKIQ